MNSLLNTIADDLSITPYIGEPPSDYCYRICYSALAYHLLNITRECDAGVRGIAKKAQTDVIQQLIEQYGVILGLETNRLSKGTDSFCQHIRRVYEETGYLTVDERNYDTIVTYGRTIRTSIGNLYFGIPHIVLKMCGMGIYTLDSGNEADLFETFLRDKLLIEEFISSKFNPIDFDERSFAQDGLEFFNPQLKKSPSSSWEKSMKVRKTIARTSTRTCATYYRVICDDSGKLLYADEPIDADRKALTSGDIRRIYIALKAYYGEPVVAWVTPLDESYIEIHLSAHLPTREYYFLLLFAWPKGNAFNKIEFIANSKIYSTLKNLFDNIGIKIITEGKL